MALDQPASCLEYLRLPGSGRVQDDFTLAALDDGGAAPRTSQSSRGGRRPGRQARPAVPHYISPRGPSPHGAAVLRRLAPTGFRGWLSVFPPAPVPAFARPPPSPCSSPALGVVSLTRADDPAAAPDAAVTLKGHAESVYATAFTPDGKYVVTGSFDKTVKVWEAATGKEFKTFGGPQGPHRPRPQRRRQPRRHARRLRRLGQHGQNLGLPDGQRPRDYAMADAVNAVAVSPDGKTVAGAGKDGLVKLWNAADGKELFTLTATTAPSSASPSAPTASCSFPAAPTGRCASGTRPTASPSPSSAPTPARSRPSPSAPTATPPTAPATTACSSSGRCRRRRPGRWPRRTPTP